MLDSNKNNAWIIDEKLCYYDGFNICGVNKLLKGPSIVNKNPYERRSLECRINLSRRFFRVGTLPDYASVVEVEDPNLIDPYGSYIHSCRAQFKDKDDHSEVAEGQIFWYFNVTVNTIEVINYNICL